MKRDKEIMKSNYEMLVGEKETGYHKPIKTDKELIKKEVIKFIKKESKWIVFHNKGGYEHSYHSSEIVEQAIDLALSKSNKKREYLEHNLELSRDMVDKLNVDYLELKSQLHKQRYEIFKEIECRFNYLRNGRMICKVHNQTLIYLYKNGVRVCSDGEDIMVSKLGGLHKYLYFIEHLKQKTQRR